MLTIGTQTPDLRIIRFMMVSPRFPHHQPVRRVSTSWAHIPQLLSLRIFGAFGSLKHQPPGLLAWRLKETLDFPSPQPGVSRAAVLCGLSGPEFDSATRLWLRWEGFSSPHTLPDIGVQWNWHQWHWWWDYCDNLARLSHQLAWTHSRRYYSQWTTVQNLSNWGYQRIKDFILSSFSQVHVCTWEKDNQIVFERRKLILRGGRKHAQKSQ